MAMTVMMVLPMNSLRSGAMLSSCSLAEHLNAKPDVRVIVIVRDAEDGSAAKRLQEAGVEVHCYPTPWITFKAARLTTSKARWLLKRKAVIAGASLFSHKGLSQLIEKEKVDVIHICDGIIHTGSWEARTLKRPLVWHFREFVELDHGNQYVDKRATFGEYARATCGIAVSDAVRAYYQEKLPQLPITTVYNGIAYNDELSTLATKKPARNRPHLLFLSGVTRSKGIFEAVDAMAELVSGRNRDCVLDVFGITSSEDELTAFNKLVSEKNLEDNVVYHGWSSLGLQDVSNYDLELTCSRSEAFGRVTAEAMCAHTPVVGANTAGTAELLADGRGFLYEQGDAKSLADTIEYALDHEDERQRVSKRAYDYAWRNFTIERYANAVLKVYEKAIELNQAKR